MPVKDVGDRGYQRGREGSMMACVQDQTDSIHLMQPHDLARGLHSEDQFFLVDCRPVLAYNSCHISGAVNVNFTKMMKKRFIAGKISLQDLVTTEEGKEKFKVCVQVSQGIACKIRWALIRVVI